MCAPRGGHGRGCRDVPGPRVRGCRRGPPDGGTALRHPTRGNGTDAADSTCPFLEQDALPGVRPRRWAGGLACVTASTGGTALPDHPRPARGHETGGGRAPARDRSTTGASPRCLPQSAHRDRHTGYRGPNRAGPRSGRRSARAQPRSIGRPRLDNGGRPDCGPRPCHRPRDSHCSQNAPEPAVRLPRTCGCAEGSGGSTRSWRNLGSHGPDWDP